jgi:hypothetical protein
VTETQWLAASDPTPMLAFLGDSGTLSGRKARLFAVACCRSTFAALADEGTRRMVEVAERFADGLATPEELSGVSGRGRFAEDAAARAAAACVWLDAFSASHNAAVAAARTSGPPRFATLRAAIDSIRAAQAALLRDLFGPLPFRPVSVPPSVRTWQEATILRLAEATYDCRQLPSGTLEPERLAVLADALEEAGCSDEDILGHLRGGGVHVRGCWVVDLLTGRV